MVDYQARHCYYPIKCTDWQKNKLKSLAFSLKFAMNLFSWKRRVMQGMFLSFKNIFNRDLHVFELWKGLANIYANLE